MPDDGELECVDLDGAVVCRGGAPAAGVVPGPPDPGWTCGARRGSVDRICVDATPELPEGATRGWRCRHTHERGERRVCRADPAAPGPKAERLPPPSCWLDKDCGAGVCRRGSCV